ncbi:MAG: glycosyltransferase [Lachnospiraceae bacterium]|nr:glycosyltransferase [Lachnospiraceae bacterium]
MKVMLLNDSFPPVIDGVVNVVMNYARIMTEENLAKPMVGTPRYPDANYDQYPYPVIPYPSIDTTAIVSGYRAGNPFTAKAIDEMKAFAPDVIHSHCPVSSTLMARILRKETDAPIIFTYHTKFDVDIARAVKAKFLQKESIKTLVDNISACDEVWVVSGGAGENLRSLGYEGRYRVMPNGVDFAKGRVDALGVAAATASYDLPEGIPVFLFVGRIIKYKGLPLILDALKQLDGEGMDYRMVFVGNGPDADELKEQVKTLGLERKVFFTGAIYDRDVLRAWNTRADLFLFPSTYDTNGLVVREAAACGIASVLIKGSCAAEGITDLRNGYLIEENAQDMARCLKEACKDLNRVHEVGQCAMDEIYLSWESAVHMAVERYGNVIELHHSCSMTERKYQSSDKFLSVATNLVNATDKVTQAPRRIYEGMLENVADMKERLQDAKDAVAEKVQDAKDTIAEHVQDAKDTIAEHVQGTKDGVKNWVQDMKDAVNTALDQADWNNHSEKEKQEEQEGELHEQ